ncbi:hypothetical protein [Thermoflavimicrobium daqui]|uniref:hypothetical protein n=1 Tax=Thermoflavimicrobium daqui TaxID=2137476 RepID=UPI00143DEDDA|nr:hypothetical protein [Thermoflavimicrobium daqui]
MGEEPYEANWNPNELLEHFGLVPVEKQLIGNKMGASRLVFTVLLMNLSHLR